MNAPTLNPQLTPFSPRPAKWPRRTSDEAVEIWDTLRKLDRNHVAEAMVMLFGDKRDENTIDALETVIDMARLGDGWLQNHSPEELEDYVERVSRLAGWAEDLSFRIDAFSATAREVV